MEEEKPKKSFLANFALGIYALGVILLFLVPANIPEGLHLSPPNQTLIRPPFSMFFSMLFLAATSMIFIGAVYQKNKELNGANKISKETRKIIEKNIENDVEKIEADIVMVRDQGKKDFNKFVYIVGILSVGLALFQAYGVLFGNFTTTSIIYWGAYLAIAAAWFGYGIYYQNKAIMITYGLWIFVEITIINGLLFL